MKSLRVLALAGLGALSLAGCGSGSLKSPDFTSFLRSFTIDTAAPDDTQPGGTGRSFLALGASGPLTAEGLCTTPPGTEASDSTVDTGEELLVLCEVSDAAFVVAPASNNDPGRAEIRGGQIVGTVPGLVTVSATKDGVTSDNTLTFRIGAAVVTDLFVTPENPPPLAVDESITFEADAEFSDGVQRPVQVTWEVRDQNGDPVPAGTVEIIQGPGTTTTVTPRPGSEGNTYTIVGTFTSPDGNGGTIEETDSATLTVSDELLINLTSVCGEMTDMGGAITCAPNPVRGEGVDVQFRARGTYRRSTGETRIGDVAQSRVTWASSNATAATIGANTGLATTVTGGQATTITATLTGSSPLSTASTSLTVTNSVCTGPLLESGGATTSSEADALCIGCSVSNADAAIDASDATFATLNTVLGLLNGSVTLNVDAASGTVIDAGSRAGFVVAKPAGLLTAEVLSLISISTRSGGTVAETAGASQSTPLGVTLLGTIGGQDAALLSFATTQPYDGIAVTFDSGLLSLLPSVNVFQACGDSAAPAP